MVNRQLEGGDSPMFNVFSEMSYYRLLRFNGMSYPRSRDGSVEIATQGFRGKMNKIYSDTYSSKEDKKLFKEFKKLYSDDELNTTWLCNQLSVSKSKSENYFLKLRFTKSYSDSEIQYLKEFSVKKKER